MAHTLITGITGSGKTTLAKVLASKYKQKGVPVLVLDPFRSKDWCADFITASQRAFVDIVFKNTSCAVFIDESGEMIGRYGGCMTKVATMSRHFGHNAHFITQRPKQLDINIRTQCANIFLFKLSLGDTKELANEFVSDKLLGAHTLRKGEYLYKIGVDGEVFKERVF